MAWYNSNWLKRKPITLTGGSSGGQSAYQMKFTVTYDSDMKSDFSDLRFTKLDGTTLLDAWMESHTASTSAIVWVETDTPANTVEADIYMYYGNSGAASDWNGAATFLQYHGAASSNFIDSLMVNPANNYAFETRAKVGSSSHNIEIGLGRDISWTGDKSFIQSYNPSSQNLRYLQTLNDGSATQLSESPCFTAGVWYNGLMTYDGTTVRGYWDLNEIGSGSTTNLPNQLMGIFLSVPSGAGEIDWAFARKYVTNPATYAFGNEESPSLGNPMWYYNMIRRRN